MSDNVSMYHYTTKEGARGIKQTGQINASRGPGDCLRGEGVYGTTMVPSAGGGNISANTGSGNAPTHYVKFRVPVSEVDRYDGHTSGGAHLVYRGNMDGKYATKTGEVGKR